MAKRYWNIVGYKKFDQIFDVTIPIDCLSDRQLKDLLKCLAAKADSSFEDIVGAYVQRKTKLAHDFLEPKSTAPTLGYMCGYDTQFVARLVDEKGNRIDPPRLS